MIFCKDALKKLANKVEKVIFTSSLKMDYYDRINRVKLYDKNEIGNFFFINKETGMPYLPTKYLEPLDIIIKP